MSKKFYFNAVCLFFLFYGLFRIAIVSGKSEDFIPILFPILDKTIFNYSWINTMFAITFIVDPFIGFWSYFSDMV